MERSALFFYIGENGQKEMKKGLTFLAATLFLLIGNNVVHAKSPTSSSLKILNHHDQEKIHGRSIRLVLRVTPSPDSHHPVHMHVYVNGRMVTMITINSSKRVLTLHHLPKGKDVISFVQANPLTHREMGNQMEGMDMSDDNMGDMDEKKESGHETELKGIEKKITITVE